MKTTIIEISNTYIELSKFLKYIGMVSSGGQTSLFLQQNTIIINNEKAKFKRQKLTNNTIIKINKTTYKIKTKN